MNLNNISYAGESFPREVSSVDLLPSFERGLVVLRLQSAVCKLDIVRTTIMQVYDVYRRALERADGVEEERELHRVKLELAKAVGGSEAALSSLLEVFETQIEIIPLIREELSRADVAQGALDLPF